MDTLTAPSERTYDLYLRPGKSRFYFKNGDCGITLTPERINWIADGRNDGAPFANIRSVQMESGGAGKNATNACVITFADRYTLTVTDANAYGAADGEQTPAYRAFVQDLHKRLIATGAAKTIAFTSGYHGTRYYVVMTCAVVLGIMAVPLPLVLWLMTGESKALFLMIGGGWMMWPMIRMINNNAPKTYDPRWPPGELME